LPIFPRQSVEGVLEPLLQACEPDQFCSTFAGDGSSVGECRKKPTACTAVYVPVRGRVRAKGPGDIGVTTYDFTDPDRRERCLAGDCPRRRCQASGPGSPDPGIFPGVKGLPAFRDVPML
jgi:hypothetical protein